MVAFTVSPPDSNAHNGIKVRMCQSKIWQECFICTLLLHAPGVVRNPEQDGLEMMKKELNVNLVV